MASAWDLPVGTHFNQAMPRLCPNTPGMSRHHYELYTREGKLQVQCADCGGYLLVDGQLEHVDLDPLPINVNMVNDEGITVRLDLFSRNQS